VYYALYFSFSLTFAALLRWLFSKSPSDQHFLGCGGELQWWGETAASQVCYKLLTTSALRL